MDNKFINLDCELKNSWIWNYKEPYDHRSAWIDLLLSSYHNPEQKAINGKIVLIKNGDIYTSVLKLSERWSWSRAKVARFLECLQNARLVNIERTSNGTLINVIKCNVQQVEEQPMLQPMLQPMNTITKKDRKEINKKEAQELFETLWKKYPNKKGKGRVSDSQKLKIYKIGEEKMIKAISRYIQDLKNESWKSPQNGSTFFNSGYLDYLDSNFDLQKSNKTDSNFSYLWE